MTGLLGWGGATEALAECDLLLMLGTDFPYHAFLPSGTTIIQVDDNASAPRPAGERRPRARRRRRRDAARAAPAAEARDRLARSSTRSSSTTTTMVKGIQTYVNHEGSGDGLRPEMVATRAERPRRRRRRLHRRHRHVQRVGRALPAHEAGPADPGVVQPRLDGQRHAAGDRRQGRLPRPAGRSRCAATAASRC